MAESTVYPGSKIYLDQGQLYWKFGSGDDKVSINDGKLTLMKDVTVSSSTDAPALTIDSSVDRPIEFVIPEGKTLILQNTNTGSNGGQGILNNSTQNLTFTGAGKLNVSSTNSTALDNYGGKIIIDGPTVEITTDQTNTGGVPVFLAGEAAKLEVKSGKLTIDANTGAENKKEAILCNNSNKAGDLIVSSSHSVTGKSGTDDDAPLKTDALVASQHFAHSYYSYAYGSSGKTATTISIAPAFKYVLRDDAPDDPNVDIKWIDAATGKAYINDAFYSINKKELILKADGRTLGTQDLSCLDIQCDCTIRNDRTMSGFTVNATSEGNQEWCVLKIEDGKTVTVEGAGSLLIKNTVKSSKSTGLYIGKNAKLEIKAKLSVRSITDGGKGIFVNNKDNSSTANPISITAGALSVNTFNETSSDVRAIVYTNKDTVGKIWDASQYYVTYAEEDVTKTLNETLKETSAGSKLYAYSYGTGADEKTAQILEITKKAVNVQFVHPDKTTPYTEEAFKAQTVIAGGKVTEPKAYPKNPSKGATTFIGWYQKKADGSLAETAWDFDQAISVFSNDGTTITLVAQFKDECKGLVEDDLSDLAPGNSRDAVLSVTGVPLVNLGMVRFTKQADGTYLIQNSAGLYLYTNHDRDEVNWVKDASCTWYKDDIGFYYPKTETETVYKWQWRWPFVYPEKHEVITYYYLNIDASGALWALNIPVESCAKTYVDTTSHSWSKWKDEGDGTHSRYCTVEYCEGKDIKAHGDALAGDSGLGYSDNYDGATHKVVCKDCAALVDIDEDHAIGSDMKCTKCGAYQCLIDLEKSTPGIVTSYERYFYILKRSVYTCTPNLVGIDENVSITNVAIATEKDGQFTTPPFITKDYMKAFYVKAKVEKTDIHKSFTYTLKYNHLSEEFEVVSIEP